MPIRPNETNTHVNLGFCFSHHKHLVATQLELMTVKSWCSSSSADRSTIWCVHVGAPLVSIVIVVTLQRSYLPWLPHSGTVTLGLSANVKLFFSSQTHTEPLDSVGLVSWLGKLSPDPGLTLIYDSTYCNIINCIVSSLWPNKGRLNVCAASSPREGSLLVADRR